MRIRVFWIRKGVIGYIFQIINVPEGDDIGGQEHVSPVGCIIPCIFSLVGKTNGNRIHFMSMIRITKARIRARGH